MEFSQMYLNEEQINLENTYNDMHIKTYLKQWLNMALEDNEIFRTSLEDIQKYAYDILAILLLRGKRISINALYEMLLNKNNYADAEWIMASVFTLTRLNLVSIEQDTRNSLYVLPLISLTDEQLELINSLQYKLPMIVEPLTTNQKGNNRGSGYYTKGSDSLILNQHHQYEICSDVLDRLNKVPFSINRAFMETISNSWKCMSEPEEMNIETLKNYFMYEKSVFRTSAIMINHGNKFWFTHKYDKRGRIYCCGYQLNTQGNSYAKAQLELANKQLVTNEINFFEE